MTVRNYLDKVNRHFWFTQKELVNFFIAVGCLSIIAFLGDWRTTDFNIITGTLGFLLVFVFMAITVFVHHAGQRFMGLKVAFKVEQTIWWYGIVIGLVLAILTKGQIQFLAATATATTLMPIHRLGGFRFGPNLSTNAKVMLAGPLANLFFAAIIKTIEWTGMFNPALSSKLFIMNLAFAGYNLLPIPPLDGAKIFFYSRLVYVFLAASIISYIVLIWLLNIYSYILALLVGVVVFFIFRNIEKK